MKQQTPRVRCPSCQQLQIRCLCDHVVAQTLPWKLVVLQDRREAKAAKNTLPLLHACLPQLTVWTDQEFSQHQPLDALLNDSDIQCVLVYPGETAQDLSALATQPEDRDYCFILLDGTWRQSLHLLHSHPRLAMLPRVRLTPLRPPGYHIRKARRPDSLSTFEAAASLLAFWDLAGANALLRSFDRWIADELARLPESIRARYPAITPSE